MHEKIINSSYFVTLANIQAYCKLDEATRVPIEIINNFLISLYLIYTFLAKGELMQGF